MAARKVRFQIRRAGAVIAVAALAALTSLPAAAHDKDAGGSAKPDPGLAITTTAGTGEMSSAGDGGPAVQASFAGAFALAAAPDGTLYVLDGARVRAIDPDGTIDTIAGSGKPGFSGDGGPAADAALEPEDGGIAAAPDGTLYIADTGNHRVRAVDPDKGTVRTVAGSGPSKDRWMDGAFKGDGGPADKARLARPSDVAVGSDGTLYIADSGNYRVRAVDPDNDTIETIAGAPHDGDNGSGFFPQPDNDGEGVPAVETFVEPAGIDVGADGTVYFTETDEDRVRAVDPDNGEIRTVAPSARLSDPSFIEVDDDGLIYVTETGSSQVVTINADPKEARSDAEVFAGSGQKEFSGDGGPPTDAGLAPGGIALADDGTLHIAETVRIRTVGPREKADNAAGDAPSADISTAAGGGQTTLEDAWFSFGSNDALDLRLKEPDRLAVDPDGTVYFDDSQNSRVASLDPGAGAVSTLAGGGEVQQSDIPEEGVDPGDAQFLNPGAVAVAPDGVRYIASEEGTFLSLDADGDTLALYSGDPGLDRSNDVNDIAVGPKGEVYFADTTNNRIQVVRKADGDAVTYIEDSGPGGASEPRTPVLQPEHIAVAKDGTVYYSDPTWGRVRAVDPDDKSVRIIAGNGSKGFSGDGGAALAASLATPKGLAVGADGTLYIADFGNNRVRAVDPDDGTIRTVAGSGPGFAETAGGQGGTAYAFTGGFAGDNGPARRAELNGPSDVAVADDGVLYIADTGNNRIRVVGDPDALPSQQGTWLMPTAILGALLAAGAAAAVLLARRRWRSPAPAGREDDGTSDVDGSAAPSAVGHSGHSEGADEPGMHGGD